MERSLFAFIWKYSKRDQLTLLAITLTLFPLLYLTLELPKRIINDAIGAKSGVIAAYGFEFSQIEYLTVLSAAFLIAVFVHGIFKMRINTMKGILAERLLRRLRYKLIARILRFPQPYFERTSQGELVSMVTAESEPMGGLMGDALAQPVLQAGQMLTILGFLFFQSITFGLAACALIPVQAWLIPRLQKQINLLNKKRVVQVRALAADIGEGAAGASTLRVNGGWRYQMAMIGDRLGHLFNIRFEIYQKKFFMKFINNFITQLTPFLFYSIGGYLVIKGEVTIGALVAALAAYKDLSSPWKELLAYYNQSADMSLRWDTITERFAPDGMIEEDLFYGTPTDIPSLAGDITLDHMTVRDGDGNPVLEDISTVFPGGSLIGITAPNEEDRRALAEVLTRETLPNSGAVILSGQNIKSLHQAVIAKRIGHATSRPVMFRGTFGKNVLMPVRFAPTKNVVDTDFAREALRTGNSPDMLQANWLDPTIAGLENSSYLQKWWSELIEGMGSESALIRRAMDQTCNTNNNPELCDELVKLRPELADEIAKNNLNRFVHYFDPNKYNPALPVLDNLLYSTPRKSITPEDLTAKVDFLQLLYDLNLADDLEALARNVIDLLRQIFGTTGTDHPLFLKVGLDVSVYESALNLVTRSPLGTPIEKVDLALLLSVLSRVTAEQIDEAFQDNIYNNILDMRQQHAATLQALMDDLYAPITSNKYLTGLSVLENALYGKLSDNSGLRGDDIRKLVLDLLSVKGLKPLVLELVFEVPISLGGANLPSLFAEPLSISRASIKRPDILILDQVMASYDADAKEVLYINLRKLLPETTLIFLNDAFDDEKVFDHHYEVQQGRLVGAKGERTAADSDVTADLALKVDALSKTPMFSELKRKQLRLLAFGARWHTTHSGDYVFHKNDVSTDGAYIVISGEADLLLPIEKTEPTLIATVGAGALVGELGLIRGEPRALDMRAKSDLKCLRISEEDFMAVVKNDGATAFKLLQVIAGYIKT
ncbi:MAG: cyclic nucleotide-binding domain-containing protein [Alphaproteobacteria bacterium]|nr:cyclic nucleotide-binding domain-containing protein [Alphaproteobacteria bacterium]MCH9832644.1 cyclic nucleotide-binding domain-containing protein [Alphaproteobacteria bacterium]